MTDKRIWITDRLPTEADADKQGDVIVCTSPTLHEYGVYADWRDVTPGWPWRHIDPWTTPTPEPTPAAPEPEPEPEPQPKIPEPLRTGAAQFYVVVVSDDNPRFSGGEPIVWEHPIRETTLQAALQRRDSIGSRYGTTYIAECRIIPELTREVPANDA